MLKRCAMDKVNTQMNDLNITEDVKDIVCAGYRSGYECMKDTLGQCSGRTREIYLEMTNKYTRPLACSPFDPISYEPATGPGGGAWILHDTVGAILMLLFGTAVIYVVV
nr:hypothetical protein BaRGS_008620 [Batillaria attramentaria]